MKGIKFKILKKKNRLILMIKAIKLLRENFKSKNLHLIKQINISNHKVKVKLKKKRY